MSAGFDDYGPVGDPTLSAGDYLLGALVLVAILAPLAWAAWRARAALLPGWSGAPARLVEVVLGLSGLILLAELLGIFDAFDEIPMIAGSIALAVLAYLLARRAAPAGTPPGQLRIHASHPSRIHAAKAPGGAPTGTVLEAPAGAPTGAPLADTAVALTCAALAAAWMVPTLAALAGGMDRADSLWYHMPLATKFVQTGSLGEIFYFDPIFFASFYPANSEVLHAVGILAFARDILSPLLNLGFVALGLLASYCIGRPYGVGPQALIGGAIALGAQMLIEFQAGEALNDIVGVAFILAAVAILVNGSVAGRAPPGSSGDVVPGEPPAGPSQHGCEKGAMHGRGAAPVGGLPGAAVAIAGLAAGLAAGTKLSFLAPVAALAFGLVVIARTGDRVRTAAWFALPALVTGGYWYLRNLVAVGNPIPFTSWGPLDLPSPERAFELRPGFSVSHYFTDTEVWWDWFFPGLEESFGFLWPLTLAAIGVGALYALWRGAEPMLRMLGGVVLFTAVAYLFTPLTAAGEEGMPIAFEWNVRYIAPAAAVGLAALPCLPALRARPERRVATLAGLAILLAATVGSLVQWEQGHVKGAVAAGLAVLACFAVIARLRSRDRLGATQRRWALGLAGVAAIGALAAGWWEQNHYLERRYQNLSPQLKLAEAVRFGGDLRDARVAIAGVRGVFNQYPFYGADLSNEVQWLGTEGDDGAWLRIPTCEIWREELAAGDFTHVVTMYDPFRPGTLTDTKEALWTREDSASKELFRDGPVSVFELTGGPDSATCGALPDLSAAELNGDSVNLEPTANQP